MLVAAIQTYEHLNWIILKEVEKLNETSTDMDVKNGYMMLCAQKVSIRYCVQIAIASSSTKIGNGLHLGQVVPLRNFS